MQTFETKTKKWGSSLGIIIPKDILEKEGVKEGTTIRVTINEPGKSIGQLLWDSGKDMKWEHTTDEIMRIIDEELWNE